MPGRSPAPGTGSAGALNTPLQPGPHLLMEPVAAEVKSRVSVLGRGKTLLEIQFLILSPKLLLTRGWQTTHVGQSGSAACFCQQSFIGTQPHPPSEYCLLLLSGYDKQSGVTATGARWPASLRYLALQRTPGPPPAPPHNFSTFKTQS